MRADRIPKIHIAGKQYGKYATIMHGLDDNGDPIVVIAMETGEVEVIHPIERLVMRMWYRLVEYYIVGDGNTCMSERNFNDLVPATA